jgi:hypothetical protein
MGIPKYELNKRPLQVEADQTYNPTSTNAQSGAAVAQAVSQGMAAACAVDILYADLLTLKEAGNLVPGRWYRITNYLTTTAQEYTNSTGHQFDILVRADSTQALNENAYAAHHSGDTYFQSCKLEAWELKYCIANDTTRFGWAVINNGFGVIYWMKDEWDNEAPYDFKNIRFQRTMTNGANDSQGEIAYVFTFNNYADGVNYDATVLAATNNKIRCCNNVISEYRNTSSGDYKLMLNNIAFLNVYANNTGYTCSGNKFGFSCRSNTFGNNCDNNTFGNSCYNNTFGNNCNNNTFGNGFQYNTFGNNCYNNTFGNSCAQNTFGNSCGDNTFGNYCQFIVVSDGAEAFSVSTGSEGHPVKYCQVLGAVYGGKSPLDIPFVADCNYTQVAGLDNSGNLVIFNPAEEHK